MGLIRGALHIASYGAVSPKSKKQRTAAAQLAATQGASEAEIKIAGSRNFDFVNQDRIRRLQQRQQRQQQAAARPSAPSGNQVGVAAELERLVALHQSGALDDDEFRAAKRRLLG